MTIHIDCHGESHVGRHRPANEDQFLISDLNRSMRIHQTSLGLSRQTRLFGGSQGKLLLVADGLGGHESGERASTLAVDGVANYILNAMDWFLRRNEKTENELKAELRSAFQHSQDMLEAEADAIPQRRGMATTLTMAYVDWPKLFVVHVGDTRCYHLRGESIKCLTTDHTMGGVIRSVSGKLDLSNDETIPFDPLNHQLYNVVGGTDSRLDPQVTQVDLAVGDMLLLTSDGLTRYLKDDELMASCQRELPAKSICEQFVQTANERGGKDNITVVLAKFCQQRQEKADCEHATHPVRNSSGLSHVAS